MEKRGIVQSFNASTYKAAVQISGSLAVWLGEVKVARNIPASEMVPGRSCAIVFFDEANPEDAVLISVYS